MDKLDLRRLPAAQRTLAIGFLISLGLAYAVALLFVFVQSELKPSGIESQYLGSPESDDRPQTQDMQDAHEEGEGMEAAVPALSDEWKNRSAGMTFPKSLKEMILTTHLHMLSISLILFLLGGIFVFSSFPERYKAPVIAAGFIGLVFTYASMWALRYGSGAFSAGVFIFGLVQALSIALQFLASLRDLLFFREKAATVSGRAALKAILSFAVPALSSALLFNGCAGPGLFPAPTAKNVAYAERHGQVTTLPTLKVGRKLYISRCSSCHDLKAPEFLAPEEWPDMVRRMADDAEITPDQERAIIHYLVSVSAAVRDTADGTASTPK